MQEKIIKLVVGMLQENCYILYGEDKNAFIVDPGGSSDLIIETIEKNKLNLKFILITHGHVDHVGAVARLKEKYNVHVYMSEIDKDFLESPEKMRSSSFGLETTPASVEHTVKEGDEIPFGKYFIKVIETPGHTLGSVCYLYNNVLFSGDTLFNGSIGRTDFPESDQEKMQQSLKKLKSLDDKIYVLCGHGPETQIGNEKLNNPFMRNL